MPMMAVAFPILPGKTAEWRAFMEEVNGPRRDEFVASRRAAGVHERTFLQSTPMGDLVIVTLEGDDPGRAFGQMLGADDDFTRWFTERAGAIHGVDLTARPVGSPPELVVDTGREVVSAGLREPSLQVAAVEAARSGGRPTAAITTPGGRTARSRGAGPRS